MPYTLAHPALVVPLRRWLVLGAAVTGAMAPDAGYYLPRWLDSVTGWPGTDLSHSLAGAVGLDAVVGLVLYLLWRWPVRAPALGSLPEPWRAAALADTAEVLPGRSWPARAVLLYASSAIGALSHVLLDVFTHERPDTPDVLVDDTVLGLPIASWLQRGLSVLGLVLIAWWLLAWARRVAPVRGFRPPAQLLALTGAVVAGGAVGAALRIRETTPTSVSGTVVAALFGSGWGAGVALLLGALALRALVPAPGRTPDSQVRIPG